VPDANGRDHRREEEQSMIRLLTVAAWLT
jgi:hypothetical protein